MFLRKQGNKCKRERCADQQPQPHERIESALACSPCPIHRCQVAPIVTKEPTEEFPSQLFRQAQPLKPEGSTRDGERSPKGDDAKGNLRPDPKKATAGGGGPPDGPSDGRGDDRDDGDDDDDEGDVSGRDLLKALTVGEEKL